MNHFTLTLILSKYGSNESLLSWLRSYLSGRYQWVKLFGLKCFMLLSGVPQVENFSFILIFLFINCIHNVLHHYSYMCFVDDIKLFIQMYTVDDCLKLQADINRFSEWYNILELSLNLSKCKMFSSIK